MKIIDWLREQWKNFKFELNLSTPKEIEERFKPKKEIPEGVIEGILGVDYVVREGIVFYSREEGEEQIKVKNEDLEREMKESGKILSENQQNIYDELENQREKLKRLDEKLTEVVKILMTIKDKL